MSNTNPDKKLEAAISVAGKGDASEFLHPRTERVQDLKGFDEDYIDIVDYILRCTHKIWEGGDIGLIYSHYGEDIPIETAEGVSRSRDAVVSGTSQAICAFPNLRLYGDDVIWYGGPQDGFHTSHRISWTGTNTGPSKYGPATGRSIYRFGIANCLVRENRIIEEWIARDEMSLVLQLGYDPWEMAAKMTARAGQTSAGAKTAGPPKSRRKPARPKSPKSRKTQETPPASFDLADFVGTALHDIWNRRLVGRVDACCADNYRYRGPSGRNLLGRGDLKAHIISLLSTFPDLKMSIDHLYWNGTEEDEFRVMVRWTLRGTHEAYGIYGPPTGKRIQLMGISHMHLREEKFVREFTSFDEFALFKQLYTPEIHGFHE